MSEEVEPLSGLLSILDRGGAQGTNKFALLLVLLDRAPLVEAGELVSLDALAFDTLGLYWEMAKPFMDRPDRLSQIRVGNRSLKALTVVEDLRTNKAASRSTWKVAAQQLGQKGLLAPAIKAVSRDLWRNPIRLLQTMPGLANNSQFLYEISQDPKGIRFVPAAHQMLIRHRSLLRELVEFRYAAFISDIPRNNLSNGVSSVRGYLFGNGDRQMPSKGLQRRLLELQAGTCIYTGEPVGARHVDHTVPWSRVRLSVIENFTVTNASTNVQKSDNILGPTALQKWLDYHEATGSSLEAAALEFQWQTDMNLTRNVLLRQYESAVPGGLQWDPIGISTTSADDIKTCKAMLRSRLA
jgi:hypothetical protein